MTRYTFHEVKAALRECWGLLLHRGGEMGDGRHDGRWDVLYSKTGYVISGNIPGYGHGGRRFATLADVVRVAELSGVIERARER